MRIANWDADFIPFYVCHSKDKDHEKSLEECIIDCDTLINNINKEIGCEAFVGFLTKGKCFRYDIYPDYKGNRKYLTLPKYLNDVKDHMTKKYNFGYHQNYEADDLVYSYKLQNPTDEVVIVSPDKDILYLEGTHYNPRLNKFVTTSKEEAEIYFWKSMIVGDSADNIKGIKGIGPKGAESIIKSQKLFSNLRSTVLEEYCKVFGEDDGISEFYKNYKCLKIVGNIPFKVNGVLNKTEITCEQT